MTANRNAPTVGETDRGEHSIKSHTADDNTPPEYIEQLQAAALSLRKMYAQLRVARVITSDDRVAAEAIRRFLLAWDRCSEAFARSDSTRALRHFQIALKSARVIAVHADQIDVFPEVSL